MTRVLALLGFVVAAVAASPPAAAQPAPVVLTVSGRIAPGPSVREFTMDALAAIGLHQLRTSTPWTEGMQEFAGVRLRDLLAAVGAQGGTLAMTALNDYTVEIPASDARTYDVIIAFRRNGAGMPVRDKGPLWVIYPYDQHVELRDAEHQARMIWQLRRIDVR